MITRRRRWAREDGQTIVIVVLFMIVLLGFCAVTLDVGHAYLAQRRLQSSVDAAALAGATELPSVGNANSLANAYGNGGKNSPTGVDGITMNVSTKCLTSVPGGCSVGSANAVTVKETGTVNTVFGGLLGFPSFTVHATATACSPCGAKPLDIMLILDRTGSMCTKEDGSDDHPACNDMTNARNGMKTFLELMDPNLDHVGLAVLPPAPANGSVCAAGNYNNQPDPYVVVPLSNDYSTNNVLDDSSPLVSAINCMVASGTTAYANAIDSAQAELVKDGRPNTQRVIVLLSDGAANTGPSYLPSGSPYRTTPCHQGMTSSAAAQSAGTIVYSIGYDVGHDVCRNANGNLESPGISALLALQGIGSPGSSPCDPNVSTQFCNQPNPAQLNTIFAKIAADLLVGTSRLVDDNAA
ncbi:MAG TPA: pilus assembly protein TadG-related protein [Gaiellaceae bacterium]|nr:pilus assembly protein TadG-related protein [Gaiellaceae bacterium]